jgi:hypothetical protein
MVTIAAAMVHQDAAGQCLTHVDTLSDMTGTCRRYQAGQTHDRRRRMVTPEDAEQQLRSRSGGTV